MGGNLQPNLIALCTVVIVLSTAVVVLRCWAALIIKTHRPGPDDLLAALTIPFIIAENAIIYWWISLGLGRHAATVPPAQIAQSPKIIFIAAFLYDTCITLPKFSALFFYHRIFGRTTTRWFHVSLWTLGALNTGWLIAAYFSTLFQCSPVHKAWDPTVAGYCFPQFKWFLGTAISSMIIDLGILVLPMPLLWSLQAGIRKKMLIMGVFVLGYCVIVVSIGRLVSLAKSGSSLENDITWGTIDYIIWVQLEGPVSVISVSLPNIFQLFKRTREHGPKYFFTGHESSQEQSTAKTSLYTRKPAVRHDFIKLSDMGSSDAGENAAPGVFGTARGYAPGNSSTLGMSVSEESLVEGGQRSAEAQPGAVHVRQDLSVVATATST